LILVLLLLVFLFPQALGTPAFFADPPNPAKAAWFLLWIQELLGYSIHLAWILVVLAIALALLPWLPPKHIPNAASWLPREQRRLNYATVALSLAIVGLTLVALLWRQENWRLAPPWSKGSRSTHLFGEEAVQGQKLIETLGCRRCHRIGGTGNLLANSLDQSIGSARPERIIEALRTPAQGMPLFSLSEPQLQSITQSLYQFATTTPPNTQEEPLKIFFSRDSRKSAFERHCGKCHQILSAHAGLLGAGRIGPNLSGLLTVHYPGSSTFGTWTIAQREERLRAWLRNPRAFAPNTSMPGLTLPEEDYRSIRKTLAP